MKEDGLEMEAQAYRENAIGSKNGKREGKKKASIFWKCQSCPRHFGKGLYLTYTSQEKMMFLCHLLTNLTMK